MTHPSITDRREGTIEVRDEMRASGRLTALLPEAACVAGERV